MVHLAGCGYCDSRKEFGRVSVEAYEAVRRSEQAAEDKKRQASRQATEIEEQARREAEELVQLAQREARERSKEILSRAEAEAAERARAILDRARAEREALIARSSGNVAAAAQRVVERIVKV